ncbi:T9SS type A sorting domain-containing protein, partial [Taibaiella lutea]
PDVNMCVDGGTSIVLDAGVQPNTPSFLWDNLTTSQVRAVNTSGTYNVKVTNSFTCVGSDTVNVLLRKNPVVHLGNDTTVCNGVVLTLNPGGGSIEYFWNTGQTGQTIDVNSAGSYSVFVTNAEGCISMDTIQVMMQGELPSIQGIQVANNGDRQFHFTAVYPQNVIGYDWDFGDGSLHSYAASPTHVYDSVGDFIVVLHLSSTCGFANDTIGAHIVGIHQLNISNNELTVYPNPSNGQATILNKGDLKMEKIEIYNILGQVVYRSKADSKDKHVVNLTNIASGVYTIEVYTDKGTVARKLEILK